MNKIKVIFVEIPILKYQNALVQRPCWDFESSVANSNKLFIYHTLMTITNAVDFDFEFLGYG